MILDLSKQLFADLSNFFSTSDKPSAKQLKVIIESALRKCNVVTREEFDAQSAVLQRTRAKLEALEKKLSDYENNHLN